jgi:hypothetical protein
MSRKRKLILGAIVLLVVIGVGYVSAAVLIGEAAGREVSRELGNSIAKALWK